MTAYRFDALFPPVRRADVPMVKLSLSGTIELTQEQYHSTKGANMYRQGDVLLIPTATTTEHGPAIPRTNGRLVLADGEATGHAHTIESERVELYDLPGVPDLTVRLLVAEVEAVLTHQEHAPVTIPPGTYRVVRQREYAPEAIRNVAD